MRPARTSRRRSFAVPAVAAAAAFGLFALPVATPTTASALPPLAVAACDIEGNLERALGEQFGGIWADVPTQHFRVGILDPAAEPIARAVVEGCDAQDALNGVPVHLLRAPTTAYVVVQSSYPAVKRAQQALVAWQSSPAGLPLSPRITSHGIGLGAGDANVDGHVGMVVRVTLHLSTTDAEASAIEAATATIAAAHGVSIVIDPQRSDYATALVGLPGPITPRIVAPSPSGNESATVTPTILGRSTASRRTALRTQRLPVRLQVAAAGTYRVTVRTADRRRTVIARGVAASKRAGQLTVRTTLTRAGRSQLRKAGRTAVTVSVQQSGQKTVSKRIVVR